MVGGRAGILMSLMPMFLPFADPHSISGTHFISVADLAEVHRLQ